LDQELPKFKSVRGLIDKIQRRIRLKIDQPIKQRYRPRNLAIQAINQEVDKMLGNGVVKPVRSAWSSPM